MIFPEDIKAANALDLWKRNQLLIRIPLIQCTYIKTLAPKGEKKIALEHVHTGSSYAISTEHKVNIKTYTNKGFCFSLWFISQNVEFLCKEVKLIYYQMHGKIDFPLREKNITSTNLQGQGVSLCRGVAWLCWMHGLIVVQVTAEKQQHSNQIGLA